MNTKTFITKLTQWEYWPTFMFYVPIIPYYLWKAIQARNAIFFLATNPAIKYSGNGTESKYKTIILIPEKHRPKSIFIEVGASFEAIQNKLVSAGIEYPIIAKPDVGFRGFLVQKISTANALQQYFKKNDINIILQEFITYKNECGIFYSRIPGESKGKITSLTLKKFLTIKGDGESSLSDLILQDSRACVYYDYLKTIHKDHMNHIPDKDSEEIISFIGNHARGTQFINGNHLIDTDLELIFDELNKQIQGWFYGRLDIKYDTLEKVKEGKDFKVLEINGIIAEPTHIYDPTTGASYFDALRSIKSHWKILSKIAVINHKKYNIAYPKFRPYIKDIMWLRSYSNKLKRLNK